MIAPLGNSSAAAEANLGYVVAAAAALNMRSASRREKRPKKYYLSAMDRITSFPITISHFERSCQKIEQQTAFQASPRRLTFGHAKTTAADDARSPSWELQIHLDT